LALRMILLIIKYRFYLKRMKRGRKFSKTIDNFSYDFNEYDENGFETQSENIDIDSIVNKLDVQIPLDVIAAEENISMDSLAKCIDYLREQRVNIDTSIYGDSLNFYSSNKSIESSFEINNFDEF